MSFALPPDLLLAALGTDEACPEGVDLLTPLLDRQLTDKPYAEIHLHMGAALDFPLLWIAALRAIASTETKPNAFHSPGAVLDEGRTLAPWLLRAAIARYVLAAYLCWGCGLASDFRSFVNTRVTPKVDKHIGPALLSSLALCLGDLWRGQLTNPESTFRSLQSLYVQLLGGGYIAQSLPSSLAECHEADPIAVFFPPGKYGKVSSEIRFVMAGLKYQGSGSENKTARNDLLFASLFWQVVRIRGLLYRHVVQRPLTPGLQWFIRFYDRLDAGSRPLSRKLFVEFAAKLAGIEKGGLRSLELRTAPKAERTKLLRLVTDVDAATASIRRYTNAPVTSMPYPPPPLEVGIVLHFIKNRGGGAIEGKPIASWRESHADPAVPWLRRQGDGKGGNPSGYRYARYYRQKKYEAMTLARLLMDFPISLEIIRGIDVCTDELGVPAWVLAPIFRYLREVSHGTSEFLRQQCGVMVPPLRITAHSGEDFVHLLTGLRNVDEALCGLDLREGDRIGHGVALGVDPREWSRRAGRIPVYVEDRLLDLVWEWSWYARNEVDPPSGRAQTLDREIARLSEKLFGKPDSPYHLEVFVEYLYDERKLYDLRFPDGRDPPVDDRDVSLRLLKRFLTEVSVFDEGRKIEWIDPSSEGEVLALLQSELRRKLGLRGITVEVNPSSNLLIGDLGDLNKHPLWRLNPPKGSGDAPPVSICIGSDDPITFATNLREEYQFVHDALTVAGLSEQEVMRWLDSVRENGMRSRFTVPRQLPFSVKDKFGWVQINPLRNPEPSKVKMPP